VSAPLLVALERVVRVAPFGLGLWDMVAGRLVTDGLSVRVFRLWNDRPAEWGQAGPNRSGVFVAHRLPWLSDLGAGTGATDPWPVLSPAQPYLVEVRSDLGQYTPFVLHVTLPELPGMVTSPCMIALAMPEPTPASPPAEWAFVPLFSAPARPVPAGMAAVRATMLDADTRKPAEPAVLEIRESGELIGRGISDQKGRVLAVFPYPEPTADRTWGLEIAIRYRRDLPRYGADPTRPPLAELCEIMQQPTATSVTTSDSPPRPLAEAQLLYGEELVLAAASGGEVLVSPA
jgi:hypothetical protein